jgi:hypothetical protein
LNQALNQPLENPQDKLQDKPQEKPKKLKINSLVFKPGQYIPAEYTCEGSNINPPLTFSGIPAKTKSLALIMEDPDVPQGVWVHWILYNIPPKRILQADSHPGKPGKNDSNGKGLYAGPCPPSGVHRYYFKVYALNNELDFKHPPGKEELENAMNGHILDKAEIFGLYSKGSQ